MVALVVGLVGSPGSYISVGLHAGRGVVVMALLLTTRPHRPLPPHDEAGVGVVLGGVVTVAALFGHFRCWPLGRGRILAALWAEGCCLGVVGMLAFMRRVQAECAVLAACA